MLPTENREDFETLHKALRREIKPTGAIEDIYVSDITWLVWEILRLRRCKTVIINAAYFDVLKDILARVSKEPQIATRYIPAQISQPFTFESEEVPSRPYTQKELRRESFPFDWFHDKQAKKELALKLARFGLDEAIIDAEPLRSACKDLRLLDEMLISLENRRDKFLRQIEAYRQSFGKRVRAGVDRVIDAEHDEISTPSRSPASPSSAA